jgi:opacity protein-like surface antigen
MAMFLPIFASDEPSRVRAGIVGIYIAISLAFAVGLAATFGTAHAADATMAPPWNQLPLKAPPARASSFDWTGFYVGGHVGYSRGNARVTVVDDDPTNFSHAFGSLIGGLQGGYNYVLPSSLLLGIEADASFLNYLSADDLAWFRTTPDTDIAEKIEFMSTVRGRLGYAFDHWMVYATGGFAWSLGRFLQTPGAIEDTDKALHLHTAGRPARARSLQLPQTGLRGSSISTPILATPMSCFRPARQQARRTTCT